MTTKERVASILKEVDGIYYWHSAYPKQDLTWACEQITKLLEVLEMIEAVPEKNDVCMVHVEMRSKVLDVLNEARSGRGVRG